MEFTIEYEQNKEEGLYRLCSDEEDGPLVGFGDCATLVTKDESIYYCIMNGPADDPDVFMIVRGKPMGQADMEPVDNFDNFDAEPAEPEAD